MSTRIHLLLLLTILSTSAISQTPQQFSYQAVVRDNNNQLVANRSGMRISILKDSVNGQSSWTETHTHKTNTVGIVHLNIGSGTVVSGTFASVPWSNGKLYVKTEMDLQGGTNYTTSGTTQLLSVPYALYASDLPVSKSGDTVTIGKSKLVIPGSRLLPGSAPASLNNGLVAYYPFNGNANDESGNGHHGTVNGATLTTDRFGNSNMAYSFDGRNNHIQVNDNTIFHNQTFSVSIWANGRDFNGFSQLFTKNFGTSANESINIVANNLSIWNLTAQVGGNNYYGTLIKSPTLFNINEWHLVTYVFNGKNNIQRIYIDASEVTNNIANTGIDYDNKPITIGSQLENNVMSYFFNGKLDDIRIYNRALTQEEITYLANN